MRSRHRVHVEISAVVAAPTLAVLVTLARAQASAPPSSEGPASAGGVTNGMLVMAAMISLFTIIGVAAKVLHLIRERSDEAMALQARVANALLVDPVLGRLPVAVSAHAPFWRGSPMTIEISGQVPTPALQEMAIFLVLRELYRSVGAQLRVEDRITVVPSMPHAT